MEAVGVGQQLLRTAADFFLSHSALVCKIFDLNQILFTFYCFMLTWWAQSIYKSL